MRADRTSSGENSGYRARSRAAEPAACGLDIEVPLITLYSGGASGLVVIQAAKMSTPGAVTSGLRTSGTDTFGPRELKAPITSPCATFSSKTVPVMVAV